MSDIKTVYPLSAELARTIRTRIEAFAIGSDDLSAVRSVLERHAFKARESAVLILLCGQNGIPTQLDDVSLVLTKRSLSVSAFKGEVSFPGGTRDDGDESLHHTALREAQEEIGLPSSYATIVGALPPMLSLSGHMISPFIAVLEKSFVPVLSTSEVDVLFLVSLARLLSDERHSVTPIHLPDGRLFPKHELRDYVPGRGEVLTYGLTANYAIMTAYIVLQRLPKFDLTLDGVTQLSSTRAAFDAYSRTVVEFAKMIVAMKMAKKSKV